MTLSTVTKTLCALIPMLFINSHYSFAQKIRTISEINFYVHHIDSIEPKAQYDFCPEHCDSTCRILKGEITYSFIFDSLQRKLLKVIVRDNRYKESKDYYFLNDQLLCIKRGLSVNYFFETDFSIGTTWKDENDPGLLKREREIATAYRFILFYKKEKDDTYNIKQK